MSSFTQLQRCMRGVVALAALAGMARAGNIYVCKGPNGVKSYQNMPCAKAADQLGKGEYSDAMARAPAPLSASTQYAVPMPAARAIGQRRGSDYTSLPARSDAPAAYRCTAGKRTWIQLAPCPVSYMMSTSVDADGYTDSGDHVNGTADVEQERPLVQQGLSRATLCDQVRAGAGIGQGGDDVDQSYERNKVKRNLCGG